MHWDIKCCNSHRHFPPSTYMHTMKRSNSNGHVGLLSGEQDIRSAITHEPNSPHFPCQLKYCTCYYKCWCLVKKTILHWSGCIPGRGSWGRHHSHLQLPNQLHACESSSTVSQLCVHRDHTVRLKSQILPPKYE